MIQADSAKCRYGGCSKSNEENEKISSGLKGLILDREFLFEILGCFSVARYLDTFPVDKRKGNLTAGFALRLHGPVKKVCMKVRIRGKTESALFRFSNSLYQALR